MNTAAKVAGFAAALAVVLGGSWAAGASFGPVDTTVDEHGHDDMDAMAHSLPGGLAVEQDGYRLHFADATLAAGRRTVDFTIIGPEGRPVTNYDTEHEKKLHLVVVRRDFTGFQHVHPVLNHSTGRWTVPVDLTPGQWRVFADVVPTGADPLVLGADLAVPGAVPAAPNDSVNRTDIVDGLTVTVSGDLQAGEHSPLTLTVTRNGVPVRDLQPYLGAYGHLVALREGDLAYLHVHPSGEPGDGRTRPGPDIAFEAEVPSAGRYHLYLDFQRDSVVHTAQFTLESR